VRSATFVIEMYWFLLRPKWIAFHLLVLLAVVVMVNLAFWQLRRLDERRTFNAEVTSRSEAPPVPIGDLLTEPGFTPDGAAWRVVSASGTWLPQQIVLFNRFQNGAAGDNVITALRQDDGSTVLVNRGFVALGSKPPAPPSGRVDILGTVRPTQVRQRGELTDSGLAVTEVRRVDVPLLTKQFPGKGTPFFLELISSAPPVTAGDPVPVLPPELSEGPHLSYAGQWFIFSICAVVGWVFAVRRSARTHRREALKAAADEQDPLDSPQPDDVAATTTTT
jgi:cytochrome oxidase assembly protein ShyY1